MANSFELTEQEVHRNRVLVAEQGLLSRPSTVAARGGGAPGGSRPHA